MLIACPKTARILWIENVGPVTGIVIIYQLVVKKIWKNILVTPLFNQAMKIWDINSYKFFIPAFLNHKFPFKIPSVAGEIPWNSSIFRSRKSQWLFWWSSSGSPAGRLWLDPMWLGSWTVRVPRERTDQGWPFDDFCWLVTSEFWSRLKTAKELLLIYIWRSPDVFCTLDFDLAPCN